MDAPDVVDDFYLNLLDWSSSNVIAVALGNNVYLWDASDGSTTELLSADDDMGPVTSVKWAADGRHLAVGFNNSHVQLWDSSSIRLVWFFPFKFRHCIIHLFSFMFMFSLVIFLIGGFEAMHFKFMIVINKSVELIEWICFKMSLKFMTPFFNYFLNYWDWIEIHFIFIRNPSSKFFSQIPCTLGTGYKLACPSFHLASHELFAVVLLWFSHSFYT